MATTPAKQRMKQMRDRRAELNHTRRDYYATDEEHASLTKHLAEIRGKDKK